MLNVKLTYSLFGCPTASSSFCKHDQHISMCFMQTKNYLQLRFGTDQFSNISDKVDTIAPRSTDLLAPLQIKIQNYDGKIIPKARGVYLACGLSVSDIIYLNL